MNNREKYLVGIIIVLIGALLFSLNRPVREEKKEEPSIIIEDEEPKSFKIAVHIGGAVRNPGLYYISSDSRVADAIQVAGGPTSEADLDAINLASKVTDGSKILVPSKLKTLDTSSDIKDSQGETLVTNSKKININTASTKELEELPGIGPALAERIVSYRETNGPFKSIEEIKKVSGIGEKKFEAIKDLIVVE